MNSKAQIFLRISEIPSFLGQNKFSFIEPFERLIKSIDPKSFQKSVKSLNSSLMDREIELQSLYFERDLTVESFNAKQLSSERYEEKIKELDQKELLVHKIIAETSTKIDDITLTIEERVRKTLGKDVAKTMTSLKIEMGDKRVIAEKIIKESATLPKAKKLRMLKETKTIISRTHGIAKEDSGIRLFEKLNNVKLDISQKLFQVDYKSNAFTSTVTIRGRLDGIYRDELDPSKDFLVEVKSRTNNFFKNLPDYEFTQVQLYCWLMNIKNAKLVEKLKDEIRVTEISYDEKYVSKILAAIDILVSKIENYFLPNEALIAEYYQRDEIGKLKFLKELYLDEINLMFSSEDGAKKKDLEKGPTVAVEFEDLSESSDSSGEEIEILNISASVGTLVETNNVVPMPGEDVDKSHDNMAETCDSESAAKVSTVPNNPLPRSFSFILPPSNN